MLKYLIVQLDDTSVSFCHYDNDKTAQRLIDLEVLKKALFWSMKENLIVQFLYPDHTLPNEYKDVIADIDHAAIVSSTCEDDEVRDNADVIVFDKWNELKNRLFSDSCAYVIRTTFADLFANEELLNSILPKVSRLNVVIKDIPNLTADIEKRYSQFLESMNEKIFDEYKNNHSLQVNILTDRMILDSMNNCGAGDETITLAPDGKFYICPGFYIDGASDVGNTEIGLDIKNQQLYKLDYAPICRVCDAWHCKRCVWQNRKATLEVNTPGREQCVVSHIERNAARNLLSKIREIGTFLPDQHIPEISYLDPFDKLQTKQ